MTIRYRMGHGRAMRFIALLAVCLGTPLQSEVLQCDDPLFSVDAPDIVTARRTCESAQNARQSLESCGVALETPIEIEIVDAFEDQPGACLGVYHCGEDRIEILSRESMGDARDPKSAFKGISDEAFWDSVLVHELTHAAYDKVECPFASCVATSEYAAYAMQVRSLSPEERALFGASVELDGKVRRDAISSIMLFMAPEKFAKYVWLHFSSRPDPCDYMRLVMQGDIVFDMEPP